jgi:hypothetical protein
LFAHVRGEEVEDEHRLRASRFNAREQILELVRPYGLGAAGRVIIIIRLETPAAPPIPEVGNSAARIADDTDATQQVTGGIYEWRVAPVSLAQKIDVEAERT